MDKVVFVVTGGMGKNIMGTVPLRGIRLKYPDAKITVVAAHPEVFRNNPNVNELFGMQAAPNFHENHRGALFLQGEAYHHPEYIAGKKHLTQCWCERIDVPFDNLKPDIYLNPLEVERGEEWIRSKNRPVLIMQWQGGGAPQVNQQGQVVALPGKMFIRNLHHKVAQNLVMSLKDKYHIVCLEHTTQPHLQGTEVLNTGLRDVFSVINSANKVLCIDSFCMHVCQALKKKATVLWCATSPDRLGYPDQNNQRMDACPDPECGRPDSFVMDVDYKGEPWQCPHGEPCTKHDEKDVIDAIVGGNSKKPKPEKTKPEQK